VYRATGTFGDKRSTLRFDFEKKTSKRKRVKRIVTTNPSNTPDANEAAKKNRFRLSLGSAVILVGYLAVFGFVVGGMFYTRSWAVRTYATEDEHEAWETWRESVRQQSKEGSPVKRRTPKSDAPPLLTLTQEYFPQILVISLVITSALYVAMTLMIRGAILSPGEIRSD